MELELSSSIGLLHHCRLTRQFIPMAVWVRKVSSVIDWRLLMAKDLTLKSFSNFRSPTVRNPLELDTALRELSKIIAMPHFRTKRGNAFEFEKIQDAIGYVGERGKKSILISPLNSR
jgi:hypothetical protein